MSLDVNISEQRPNVFFVGLSGKIDSNTYLDLEKYMRDLIADDTKAVIFDMSGIDYVSSAGIRSVIWTKKAMDEKNGAFSMVGLQPKIEKIFDTMKLLPVFDIYDDMPEADKLIDQMIDEEMKRGY